MCVFSPTNTPFFSVRRRGNRTFFFPVYPYTFILFYLLFRTHFSELLRNRLCNVNIVLHTYLIHSFSTISLLSTPHERRPRFIFLCFLFLYYYYYYFFYIQNFAYLHFKQIRVELQKEKKHLDNNINRPEQFI